jgi:hypothetical protein
MHTGHGWGGLREGDDLEDLGVYQRIILKCILKKCNSRAWTKMIWPRIRTGGWFL